MLMLAYYAQNYASISCKALHACVALQQHGENAICSAEYIGPQNKCTTTK